MQEHDARATFFVIGAAAAAHPGHVAAIAAAGHELGNHMAADEPSWRLRPDEFAAQAASVEQLLAPHRGETPARRWFRCGSAVAVLGEEHAC